MLQGDIAIVGEVIVKYFGARDMTTAPRVHDSIGSFVSVSIACLGFFSAQDHRALGSCCYSLEARRTTFAACRSGAWPLGSCRATSLPLGRTNSAWGNMTASVSLVRSGKSRS